MNLYLKVTINEVSKNIDLLTHDLKRISLFLLMPKLKLLQMDKQHNVDNKTVYQEQNKKKYLVNYLPHMDFQ